MIPQVPLAEACEVTMGQAPVGSSYNTNKEGYALIAGAGDFGEITPEPKKHTVKPTRISKSNDLILCIRATIGDLNWSDAEYCLGRGVAGLRPMTGRLDRNYLWHFIQANKDQLIARGTGSTFKQVSRSHIEEWNIPLPPLEEQKRIAAILDKADAIRRKRQHAIDLTDQLLRSVFLDMFGDPVTNPKGWVETPLVELCAEPLRNGAYYPKESYTNDDVFGIRMIHMSDAFYGFANIEKAKRVEIPEKDIKKYGLQDTDLLIARRSLTLEGAAKPCRIQNSSEDIIYESSLIRIRPNLSEVLPEYLYYFLSDSRARQKYLLKFVTSSTISGINQSNLAKVIVLVPDITTQKKFIDFLKKCESNINHQRKSESNIENLFSSLTQRAFRGELTKQSKAA